LCLTTLRFCRQLVNLHNEVWYHESAALLEQLITLLHMTHKVNKTTSYCRRTSVACWTTHCVKGLLSFNPLAFAHVPPDVTTSKLCGTRYLETLFGILFTKFMVYFSKEISDFQLRCGRFFPRKYNLISENFKLVSQIK